MIFAFSRLSLSAGAGGRGGDRGYGGGGGSYGGNSGGGSYGGGYSGGGGGGIRQCSLMSLPPCFVRTAGSNKIPVIACWKQALIAWCYAGQATGAAAVMEAAAVEVIPAVATAAAAVAAGDIESMLSLPVVSDERRVLALVAQLDALTNCPWACNAHNHRIIAKHRQPTATVRLPLSCHGVHRI